MGAFVKQTKRIALGWMRFGIALAVLFVLVFILMAIGEVFEIGPPPM